MGTMRLQTIASLGGKVEAAERLKQNPRASSGWLTPPLKPSDVCASRATLSVL